jgi:4-amino-4-deoxy-L-arabinose transferase-like glycosyltransferase
MAEASANIRRLGWWVAGWVTMMLVVSAGLVLAYWLPRVFLLEDTDALESPLVMTVARQVVEGPEGLYGPYGAQNPWVLMHPPLYYRLAALLAWPLRSGGWGGIAASLLAGRLLSLLALGATLLAAFRTARLGGGSRRAGWWAALLIVAVPVLGASPFAVRADMLGVAFQTLGFWLVLSSLEAEVPSPSRLMAAFVLFGLAACTKQHLVVGFIVGVGLCVVARRRGRLRARVLERGLLAFVAVVALIYGVEEVVTGGRMFQAVFVAAANVRRVHPSSWPGLAIVTIAVMGKSAGLVMMLLAATLANVRYGRGIGGAIAALAGTAVIGVIAVLTVTTIVNGDPLLSALLVVADIIGLVTVLPLCGWLATRGSRREAHNIEPALWTATAGELAVMAILARLSTGAWVNYAIPAVVFASIPTARLLARACDSAAPGRALWPALVAAPVVLAIAIANLQDDVRNRFNEREPLAWILEHAGFPNSRARFFVDRPGLNRLFGRIDLIYDQWLYRVFEYSGLAEPRSTWLRAALTTGPIRAVFLNSKDLFIDGIPQSMPQLGYSPELEAQPYYVWERVGRARLRDQADWSAYEGRSPGDSPGERR